MFLIDFREFELKTFNFSQTVWVRIFVFCCCWDFLILHRTYVICVFLFRHWISLSLYWKSRMFTVWFIGIPSCVMKKTRMWLECSCLYWQMIRHWTLVMFIDFSGLLLKILELLLNFWVVYGLLVESHAFVLKNCVRFGMFLFCIVNFQLFIENL